jgi:GAF domain.
MPIIRGLLTAVFPPALWEAEPMAVVVPFCMKPVVSSPAFQRLFLDEDGSFKGEILVGKEVFFKGRIARAYLRILREFYGVEENLDFPIVCRLEDPDTGLDRYFRLQLNPRFVEITPVADLPPLSEEDKLRVLENLNHPEVLRDILPPENFEIKGLTLVQAVDVTQSEIISALERDLIDQDSIFTKTGFLRLQERLRTLFRRPDLLVGFGALHEDQVFILSPGESSPKGASTTRAETVIPRSEFQGSLYERAISERRTIRVPDMVRERLYSRLDEEVLSIGGRSLLVAPLTYQGEVIGTMHLVSPRPGDLGPVDALVLEQILPIFSMAAKRGLDEIEHMVQGVIKEKCTAVHPSVEWRFRRAALSYLEKLRSGQPAELEPIVFKEVYPLYGIAT